MSDNINALHDMIEPILSDPNCSAWRKELSQAIPPAYTEWIGRELMQVLAVSPREVKQT